jgi:hypothetical protein
MSEIAASDSPAPTSRFARRDFNRNRRSLHCVLVLHAMCGAVSWTDETHVRLWGFDQAMYQRERDFLGEQY